MFSLDRRRWIQAALGACGAAGAGMLGLRRGSAADRAERSFSHDFTALGTEVSLTVLGDDEELARRAMAAAAAEIERVEQAMSLYRGDSQLVQLNARGRIERPEPRLLEVLRLAQETARRSDGAFDATVQPLWSLYRDAQRHDESPSAAAVERARRQVDWRRLEVTQDGVRLAAPGMQVTLNGIAQGYAADRAVAVLRRHGIRRALVNAGEVAPLGDKGPADPWKAGIQHPRQDEALLAAVALRGRCLATSGDYATTFSPDFSQHHLFDPATGRSPVHFSSVSVAAPSAAEADALSTAVFVLGPERGLQLVRSLPAVDALLVFKDGRWLATAGFPQQA